MQHCHRVEAAISNICLYKLHSQPNTLGYPPGQLDVRDANHTMKLPRWQLHRSQNQPSMRPRKQTATHTCWGSGGDWENEQDPDLGCRIHLGSFRTTVFDPFGAFVKKCWRIVSKLKWFWGKQEWPPLLRTFIYTVEKAYYWLVFHLGSPTLLLNYNIHCTVPSPAC